MKRRGETLNAHYCMKEANLKSLQRQDSGDSKKISGC